jgi:hypothetical protein
MMGAYFLILLLNDKMQYNIYTENEYFYGHLPTIEHENKYNNKFNVNFSIIFILLFFFVILIYKRWSLIIINIDKNH